MCQSYLDHHLMIRDADARLKGVTALKTKPVGPVLGRIWTAICTKFGVLLKGFARV